MSKSPEPIILAVALLLLALGSATLAYIFPSVDEITGVKSMEPKGRRAGPLKAEDIAGQTGRRCKTGKQIRNLTARRI